jgi:hypothetical protein
MYILPLIMRELNVAQRRRSTFVLRAGFGVGTMAFTAWAFLVWQGSPELAGHALFTILGWIALGGSLITAILLASDSLSREKRDGTLGFLFLTNLQADEIVVGKLAAAAVVPVFTLMAMFPSFAVCQLLGSVTAGEFWRVMLALLVSLVSALALTVWISSCCTNRRVAIGSSAVALLVLNPLWLVLLAFDRGYSSHRGLFWLGLLLALAGSRGLIFWAAAKLDASWRDKEFGLLKSEEEGKKAFSLRRLRLANFPPVEWLILRSEKQAGLLWLLGAGLGLLVAYFALNGGWIGRKPAFVVAPSANWGIFFAAFLLLHLLAKLLLLGRAAHQLFADRQDGNLELLLATSLSTEELFEGFKNALRKRFVGPIVFIIAVDLLGAGCLLDQGTLPLAPLLPLICGALFWPEILILIWVGVYRILLGNHLAAGLLAACLRALIIPPICGAFALIVFRNGEPIELAFMWMLGNLCAGFCFFVNARSALLKHGRTLLLRPYGEKPPEIESEWSAINWEEADWQGDTPSKAAAKQEESWSPFNWEEESRGVQHGS